MPSEGVGLRCPSFIVYLQCSGLQWWTGIAGRYCSHTCLFYLFICHCNDRYGKRTTRAHCYDEWLHRPKELAEIPILELYNASSPHCRVVLNSLLSSIAKFCYETVCHCNSSCIVCICNSNLLYISCNFMYCITHQWMMLLYKLLLFKPNFTVKSTGTLWVQGGA